MNEINVHGGKNLLKKSSNILECTTNDRLLLTLCNHQVDWLNFSLKIVSLDIEIIAKKTNNSQENESH